MGSRCNLHADVFIAPSSVISHLSSELAEFPLARNAWNAECSGQRRTAAFSDMCFDVLESESGESQKLTQKTKGWERETLSAVGKTGMCAKQSKCSCMICAFK